MAKTKISEFSSTPANNTDIDSINIAEGCAPSNINDAIRELMAQLKDFQTGAVGDSFNGPIGTSTAAAGAFTTLSASGSVTLSGGTANGVTYLNGSKVLTSGSALTFDGTNLGIGTSSPSSLYSGANNLVVGGGSGGTGMTIYSGTASVGRLFFADGTSGADAYRGWVEYSHIGNDMTFGTNAATKLTIDSAGNLGLGVTPNAGWSARKVVQLSTGSSFYGYEAGGDSTPAMIANAYWNGSQYIYISSRTASLYYQNAGTHNWFNAPSGTAGNAISFTQAMTLDASGNLGVGATSPAGKLDVRAGTGATLLVSADATNLVALNNYNSTSGFQDLKYAGSTHQFFTGTAGGGSVSERARIDSSGNLLVGTTNSTPAESNVSGASIASNGTIQVSRAGAAGLKVNRGTDDGELVGFLQAGTQEGNITVSGTTVSYNGGHLSRYAQTTTAKDNSLVKGTVLSNLDEMNVYTKDGQPVENEQLNKVKVSDTEGDANVAGVFVNWSHDEDHNVDEINMAMTGDMIIRIAQGVTVVRGDLLMSAGDGTAKPQGDDIIRSKTVAKVTSNHVTCTYADGSYCVPCVLMAC